jgi:hypothetical protein
MDPFGSELVRVGRVGQVGEASDDLFQHVVGQADVAGECRPMMVGGGDVAMPCAVRPVADAHFYRGEWCGIWPECGAGRMVLIAGQLGQPHVARRAGQQLPHRAGRQTMAVCVEQPGSCNLPISCRERVPQQLEARADREHRGTGLTARPIPPCRRSAETTRVCAASSEPPRR